MRGATTALLWEIWLQHRQTVAVIAGLTVTARLLDFFDARGRTLDTAIESSPLITLLAMVAFLLLFAVFNYTDARDGRGVGRFPGRLFTLPVSSLRLVAVPTLTGVVAVELLYLLWMAPLTRGGSASPFFTGVLLAALMVFYLAVLWTCERAGPFRLVILGAIVTTVFAIGVLPSFPPTPPPPWRSESVLATLVAAAAVVAFMLTWLDIARLRAGGVRSRPRLESLFEWIAEAMPARRTPFGTPAAAHFWFEWRCSGIVLPALVGSVVGFVIAPMSWLMRSDAGDTMRLLIGALAAPVVLAIPVGAAFCKPTFWSEDLALAPFVAVRPLSADDLVAAKVKVAAASVALSWVLVLCFLVVWLPLWANLESLSALATQLWAFHGRSVAAMSGIAALVLTAGILLTWRFMVIRLWSGLSGRRALFLGSVASIAAIGIAGMVLDVAGMPGWLLADPARLAPIVWIAAAALIAKYWIAAYAWRRVAPRYRRPYLLVWLAGTSVFLTLGVALWGILRMYVPVDGDRLRTLLLLLALITMPLGRVGVAVSALAHSRHR